MKTIVRFRAGKEWARMTNRRASKRLLEPDISISGGRELDYTEA